MNASISSAASTVAARAVHRTATYLRTAQHEDTFWVGSLSSSALATAMCLVLLQTIDRAAHADRIARGRAWLLATQHEDAGWGDAVQDPSNIHSTSLAISALTFTRPRQGPDAAQEPLVRAQRCLDRFGGWEAVGDPARAPLSGPCRTLAALAGLMDPRTIKHLRPEVVLLPPPLRRTVSTTFPAYLSFATLHSTMAPHPLNHLPSYKRARAAVVAWLDRAQGPNGSFEESAFLTGVIVLCMTLTGHRDLPWLEPALHFILDSQRDDGSWPIDRDLETFDTAMTVFAFTEAGLPVPGGPSVRGWLKGRQFTESCFPTSAPPGGWAWAMPAGWPECDDTSYVLLALLALGVPASDPAIRRGVRWLEGMQNSDGSWSTFVRNSRMPFDHQCPYITGHVLCALQAAGRLREKPHLLARALRYLRRVQRYDGSFASVWFRETVAGTASVLEALADCRLLETDPALRARQALLRLQNDDGGWGGQRLEASTAEETSWAVLALLRYGTDDRQVAGAAQRGVDWLCAQQREDGTWAQAPIGLYFSAMWYSDSYFAVTLPMRALARARVLHAGP